MGYHQESSIKSSQHLNQCCGSEITVFSDLDPTFQEISDPDPDPDSTWFLTKEEKAKILKEKCSKNFNFEEEIWKGYQFIFLYSKIDNNAWVLSRLHAILVTETWSLSVPDPKLIIPDPDPANSFGSVSGSKTLVWTTFVPASTGWRGLIW